MDLTTTSALFKIILIGVAWAILIPVSIKIPAHYLLYLYIFILPFSVFFSGNPLLNVILVFLLFIITMVHCRKNKASLKGDSILFWFLVFVFSLLPSIIFSPFSLLLDHTAAWLKFFSTAVFYFVFLAVIDTQKKFDLCIKVLIITMIAYSAAAFAELLWFPYQGSQGWRIRGPFHEYELFSEYLAVILPLIIYKCAINKKRILLIGLSGLVVILMIMTGTRGGPIALACGFIFWWALERQRLKNLLIFTLLLTLIIPIGLTGYKFLNKNTRMGDSDHDIVSRFESTKFDGIIPDTRARVWALHLKRIESTWFMGNGPCHTAQWYYTALLKRDSEKIQKNKNILQGTTASLLSYPHNLYITLLELGGVFCLIFFIIFIAACYLKLFKMRSRLIRSKASSESLKLTNVLIVMLTIFVIDELKIEFIRYHHYMLTLFSCLFCLIGSSYRLLPKNEFDEE